jgi:hypothetical protein
MTPSTLGTCRSDAFSTSELSSGLSFEVWPKITTKMKVLNSWESFVNLLSLNRILLKETKCKLRKGVARLKARTSKFINFLNIISLT